MLVLHSFFIVHTPYACNINLVFAVCLSCRIFGDGLSLGLQGESEPSQRLPLRLINTLFIPAYLVVPGFG